MKKVKKGSKRGRPSGSINKDTRAWLKQNSISEDIYKKIITRIKG